MQEKWNNFVYALSEAKKKGVDEDIYHEKIENQLQFLGWLPYKGDICHKPNIPIGNSNYIQPDILVKKRRRSPIRHRGETTCTFSIRKRTGAAGVLYASVENGCRHLYWRTH